jgi:hypothetical protein
MPLYLSFWHKQYLTCHLLKVSHLLIAQSKIYRKTGNNLWHINKYNPTEVVSMLEIIVI